MIMHLRRIDLVIGIFLVGCLCFLSQALSGEAPQDPIISHLEFLGYACDLLEGGIRARHPSKAQLFVTQVRGGIRMQTGFRGTGDKLNEAARFVVLNATNARMRVARVYWTSEGHLVMDAWIPGEYEKPRFASFMEAWDGDIQVLRDSYQELKPYLLN
jgi:hypothetical protein